LPRLSGGIFYVLGANCPLIFTTFPVLATSMTNGLPAQEGGDLDDVEHLGGGIDLLEAVHVRQDGDAELVRHAAQYPQAFLQTRPPEGLERTAVCLVVGRFKNERDMEVKSDLFEP
jgi:hypothetical protein